MKSILIGFGGYYYIPSVAFQKLYDPPLDAKLNVDSENGLTEDQF